MSALYWFKNLANIANIKYHLAIILEQTTKLLLFRLTSDFTIQYIKMRVFFLCRSIQVILLFMSKSPINMTSLAHP